jgi:cystathionine beta-lyase/cystathionine gamma-synthase
VPLVSPPLGAAVPPSPHATVVSLPTLADVEGYERKDPATLRHITQGYPRFVRHRLVGEAADRAAAALGRSGELFPLVSRAVAERLARRAGAPVASLDAVADWWLLATPAGDAATRLAKFVQHTGALISSRQAAAYLAPERRHVGSPPAPVRRALAPYLAGVAEADVLLATSGMNAVDAALAAIDARQRPRGRRAWIQLGWLYVDSARLLEKAEEAPRHFVADVRDLAAVERLLAAGDVAGVLVEIPNNPQLETADVPALRALCDRHGAMLLLDPSSVGLATVDVLPWADVLCCSLTKYAAADGDVMAGVLAVNPARPDAAALLAEARARLEPLHPLDTAALAAQVGRLGEVTARLSANAAELARRLAAHPAVARVRTADAGPTAAAFRAVRRPGAGAGALLTVELRVPLRPVYDRLAVVKGPSFGLRFTLAAPFLWLAHFEQVTTAAGRAELRAAGLDPDLLRVSVGTESPEEIWAAFTAALG